VILRRTKDKYLLVYRLLLAAQVTWEFGDSRVQCTQRHFLEQIYLEKLFDGMFESNVLFAPFARYDQGG
jgi:hypothetical protein